jgi:hypothetical protein
MSGDLPLSTKDKTVTKSLMSIFMTVLHLDILTSCYYVALGSMVEFKTFNLRAGAYILLHDVHDESSLECGCIISSDGATDNIIYAHQVFPYKIRNFFS